MYSRPANELATIVVAEDQGHRKGLWGFGV
jgi:hypothetical protein